MTNLNIGAQLHTIREFTKNAADFAASMKKVADIGYKYVQISNIGPIPAKEVADICASNGLEIIVTHTNPAKIKNETETVIEEHNIMKAKYVGIGSMPKDDRTAEGMKKFIAEYAPVSETLKKAGMTLMYHNHAFEFEKYGDKLMIEHLRDELPLVGFIIDTYWVQSGGADPAAWLTKLSGRVPVIHFKDMSWVQGEQRMAEIMEGNLNWPAIFDACQQAGVEYAMVEQDTCYGGDPFDALRTSFNNLKGALQ